MIFDSIRNSGWYEHQERVSEISHFSENSLDAAIGLLEERGGKPHIPKNFFKASIGCDLLLIRKLNIIILNNGFLKASYS